MYDVFGSFPYLYPGWALLAFIVLPLIPLLSAAHHVSHERVWRGGKTYSWLCNIAFSLYTYAPMIVIFNLLVTLALLLNQGSFAYQRLAWSRNFHELFAVNLHAYDNVNSINYLTSYNSYNAIINLYYDAVANTSLIPNHRRLVDEEEQNRRRLQELSLDTSLTITYHTSTYTDLLNDLPTLNSICTIEQKIYNGLGCLNTLNHWDSLLTQLYPTGKCTGVNTTSAFKPIYTNPDNAKYLQDYLHDDHPKSAILSTYTKIGSCGVKYSASEFYDVLNSFATTGGISITYTNDHLNTENYEDISYQSLYYYEIACIIAFVLLVINIRNLTVALFTMFGIFFALINAMAFLPLVGYKSFYTFAGLANYITLAYGVMSMMHYQAAWRRETPAGAHPSAGSIMKTYITFGQSFAYLTLIGVICTIILYMNPTIVVQQFGIYLTLNILSYYTIFHYLLIPVTCLAGWFRLPLHYIRFWKERRDACCPCYEPIYSFCFRESGWQSIPVMSPATTGKHDSHASGGGAGHMLHMSDNNPEIPPQFYDEEGQGTPHTNAAVALEGIEEEMDDEEISYVVPTPAEARFSVGGSSYMQQDGDAPSVAGSEMTPSGNSLARKNSTANNSVSAHDTAPIDASSSSNAIVTQPNSPTGATTSTADTTTTTIAPPATNTTPTASHYWIIPANTMEIDTNICRGKRPLKCYGCLTFVVMMVGLLIVIVVISQKFHIDLALPTYVLTPTSTGGIGNSGTVNMYEQYKIFRDYKSALFTNTISDLTIVTSVAPTFAPTRAPGIVFSQYPTAPPTTRPPSAAPTNTPSPTVAPSFANTFSPTYTTAAASSFISYSINTCWGIRIPNKHYHDEMSEGEFHHKSFQPYMLQGGLLSDMHSFCDYIEYHRKELGVHPNWQLQKDCIFYEYETIANLPANQGNSMSRNWMQWAKAKKSNGNMIGFARNATSSTNGILDGIGSPVWVCDTIPLFTASDDTSLTDYRKKWDTSMNEHGAIKAQAYGVYTLTSSPTFTYPLLATTNEQFVLYPVFFACIITVFGLFFVFTLGDYGISTFGSVTMFSITAVIYVLHVYLVHAPYDFYDLLFFPAIIFLYLDFPIQLIEEYMASRAYFDRNHSGMAVDQHIFSPALHRTNLYVRKSILFPALTLVGIALPAWFSQFTLFTRVTSYFIMIAIVSTFITVFFLPYLLAFGCRTRHFERLCYVDDGDQNGDILVGNAGGAINTVNGAASVAAGTKASKARSKATKPPNRSRFSGTSGISGLSGDSGFGDASVLSLQFNQPHQHQPYQPYTNYQTNDNMSLYSRASTSTMSPHLSYSNYNQNTPTLPSLPTHYRLPPLPHPSMYNMPPQGYPPSQYQLPVGSPTHASLVSNPSMGHMNTPGTRMSEYEMPPIPPTGMHIPRYSAGPMVTTTSHYNSMSTLPLGIAANSPENTMRMSTGILGGDHPQRLTHSTSQYLYPHASLPVGGHMPIHRVQTMSGYRPASLQDMNAGGLPPLYNRPIGFASGVPGGANNVMQYRVGGPGNSSMLFPTTPTPSSTTLTSANPSNNPSANVSANVSVQDQDERSDNLSTHNEGRISTNYPSFVNNGPGTVNAAVFDDEEESYHSADLGEIEEEEEDN